MGISDWSSDVCSSDLSAFQIAKTEEEQIGRHSGSGGECHLCLAAAKVPAGLDRHVADGKLIRRNNGGQIEGGFVDRLIPARNDMAGVRSLEMSEKRPLLFSQIGRAACRERGCTYG